MKRYRGILLGVVTAASVVMATTNGQAANSHRERIEDAMRVRMFQTEMMVAGLGCNALETYNNFVRVFETQLVANSVLVRAHFKSLHGNRKGTARLDRFLTRLANAASQMNSRDAHNFCSTARAILRLLNGAPDTDLRVIAKDRSRSPAWRNEPEIDKTISTALNGIK